MPPRDDEWREFGEFKQKLLSLASQQTTHEAVCAERWKAVNDKMKWGFIIIGFLVAVQLGAEKADLFLKMVGVLPGGHSVTTTVK